MSVLNFAHLTSIEKSPIISAILRFVPATCSVESLLFNRPLYSKREEIACFFSPIKNVHLNGAISCSSRSFIFICTECSPIGIEPGSKIKIPSSSVIFDDISLPSNSN